MDTIFQIAALIMSVVVHEVSHGYAARALGDSTAEYAGRLTLNPVKHIDLWGSIIIPIILVLTKAGFIIGWAKPVPVNPYNLRNQRWGEAIVAAAGPGLLPLGAASRGSPLLRGIAAANALGGMPGAGGGGDVILFHQGLPPL